MIPELIFAGILLTSSASDSLGIETVQGQIRVIHKVDAGETLYSLSRRYRVSVDELKKSNPGLAATLDVGQILKVPVREVIHSVKSGETLFALSRLYQVSVSDLRTLNQLTSDALSVGQRLVIQKPKGSPVVVTPIETSKEKIVVAAGETLYGLARKYNLGVQDLRTWNKLENDDLVLGQEIWIKKPEGITQEKKPDLIETERKPEVREVTKPIVETKPVEPATNIIVTPPANNDDEVVETGVAEAIRTGTASNRKYLALHKTAAVGSILKVRNELNGREVFVRVVGKIQDLAQNQKILIQISQAAYERLGAIDDQFRVTITYYK